MKNFTAFSFMLFLILAGFQKAEACPHTCTDTQYEYYCSLVDNISFSNNITGSCFSSGDYCEWTIEKKVGNSFQFHSSFIQFNAGNFNHTFTSGGVYRVFFTWYDSAGNVLGIPGFTGPDDCKAIVNIYDAPSAANFVVNNFDCSTNTLSIDVDAGYPYSIVSIDWGDGNSGGGLPTGFPFTHTYSGLLQASYTVTVTVGVYDGCHQGEYTFTDVIRPIPALPWQFMEPSCEGMQVCMFAEIEDLDFFQWLDSENNPISGQMTSGCVTIPASGDYTVLIMSAGGCLVSETFTFTLTPTSPGVLYSNEYYITPWNSFELNSGGNPDGDYIVYELFLGSCVSLPQWIPIGWGPLPSMSTFTVPVSVVNSLQPCMLNGDFEFCFRARVFCEDPELDFYNTTSATTNEICLPICAGFEPGGGGGDDQHLVVPESDADEMEDSGFSIFPNPTSNKFNLSLKSQQLSEGVMVQVLDINGQTLLDYEFSSKDNFLKEEIDLSHYPAGIYVIKVSGEQVNFSKLLVKQ